ncbi:hypothetical protein MFLAVUS_006670 [Mucor flavus]|uniref:DMAP1-binding domain-containing protein n=1 Tax=Mucor flavus TaxID=439312 RepID=A0ABP9Z257_9FUNG
MSKFSSYDDLPLDVAYELERLEFELQEGDITRKGYDKKKASILAPYQELLSSKTRLGQVQQEPSLDDLGPEPSAAEVQDFLDFLPSPTNSPVNRKGTEFMEENHKYMKKGSSAINSPPPPLPPQPHFQPRPPPPLPSQHNWTPNNNNVRPFDPRMGPVRPMYGFPTRPPPLNGHRPLPTQPGVPPSPMFMNRPYSPHRPPPPPVHHIRQHSRNASLESSPEFGLPFGIRQSSDSFADSNWETSSSRSGVGREPSLISMPSRLRQSNSTSTGFSSMDSSVARSQSSRGRSRYRDCYMASTFKAIEPAPQPELSLNDPMDQMFLSDLAGRQMTPLKGRPIPFQLLDADNKTCLSDFKNLAQLLRYRANNSRESTKDAFTLVDARGKEPISLSWEKLNARAEKIARSIKSKGKVNYGDRVALIYRKSEVLDFIPALFGCFLAGVTAVPINAAEDLSELSFILTLTNIYLILTTEYNQRAFTKDMQAKSIEFPPSIRWWRTNDLGTWYPDSKKAADYPPIRVPEIAYIEYAKANNGELKGVTVTHDSIMEQCAAFQAATTETVVTVEANNVTVKPKRAARSPETMVTYFEPRQQIGLVISVLHSVYAGTNTIFASSSIIDTPAIWIYVLSKYKATIALADYAALRYITNYYQSHSKEVKNHSKKIVPDLSSLRNLIVDTNTVNPELNEYVADKLLRPLCNTDNPLQVVCPVLSLPEHGGKILSMRDNLGPAFTEEFVERDEIAFEDGQQVSRPVITTQSVLAHGGSRDVFSCLFDAQALKANKVMVLAAGNDARKAENLNEPGRVRVEAFGFCMPKTTVAIVDPNTATLCPPDTFGEVWMDSPAIAGGFWALPKHTECIFNARPLVVPSENLYPQVYGENFLRTGLCGTVIGGRLFILGTYEDRIRQQRFGADFGIEDYYYASDLLNTIRKRARIEQCTIFEILVKKQHLPVIACETSAPRADLLRIATEVDEALIEFHGLRAYAIIFVGAKGLPKQIIHGRRSIHPLLTKRHFLQGQLAVRYIKIDVDRTIFNLAYNEDPSTDMWLSGLAYETAIRSGAIMPHPQPQHTGMEKVSNVVDERTEYDISRFTNIVDVLQWRTAMYPEEIAYIVSSQSGANVNTKQYSWKKISYKAATVAAHLTKKGLKRNTKVLVVMPFGIEYILCIYACLSVGVIPVPLEQVDPILQPNRVNEFASLMIQVIQDLGIAAMLTNSAGDDVMRHHAVKAAIRAAIPLKFKLPDTVNISKAPKHHKTLGKESGFMVRPDWITNDRLTPTIILVQNSSDGLQCYTYIGHDTILNQCRTQKMTCQMKSQRGIVTTGLGTYEGLGFLYALFCGVYVGCSTVLIPSADFYINPISFFESLQRYKTKDTFLTNALVQFAMNRIDANDGKQVNLKGVQNLMLSNDNRPKPLLYQHMARYFARQRLDKEAINTVYSHVANPMITTRSYMLMEPISLSVDPYWLRQRIIRPLGPEEEPYGILLNDSGIVPSNTMVAIVNPETHIVCPSNTLGEIWVCSDSNAKTYHNLDTATHVQKFEATIAGNDPSVKYMRTGDYGFLWSVRRRVDNRMMAPMLEEGQCLYVLGPINETLVRNGLMYFPLDVELSIERCHRTIPSGGSIVFQDREEIVAVVSIKANEYALSVVPLVVNSILENHLFLVDTVVIVHPNHFPRSRFGDKMRRRAKTLFVDKKLTVVYVKRITNQHRSLMLPQWAQSQLSISDINYNNDNMSIHTMPRTQSVSDFNTEYDGDRLVRQNTDTSHKSQPNNGHI